jgi:hypothetical protein
MASLRELKARVAVARAAGAGAPLDDIKSSVGRLNSELSAITEAMEAVQSPVADVPAGDALRPRERLRE